MRFLLAGRVEPADCLAVDESVTESNPYMSPHAVSSSKANSRAFVIIRNLLIYSYLLGFCLIHAVGAYVSIAEAVREDALNVWHFIGCIVLLFIAVAIFFYATDRQPQRFIKGWQSLPYWAIFIALSALSDHDGLAALRTETRYLNDAMVYVIIGIVGLIMYGPAIYMCFRVAYPPKNGPAVR